MGILCHSCRWCQPWTYVIQSNAVTFYAKSLLPCHSQFFFSHRDRAVDAKYLLLNQFTRMNCRIHRIMLQDSWQQTDMSNICTTLARCHFVLAPTAINSNAMKSSATIKPTSGINMLQSHRSLLRQFVCTKKLPLQSSQNLSYTAHTSSASVAYNYRSWLGQLRAESANSV